jgi:MarR family transcriptional regulator for hemolysin
MLRDRTLTIHELADAVSVRLPTMSRTIDTLCGKGWTERYHEPEDRRTVHVRIKEEGLLALEKTEDLARRTVLTILEGMSSEALGELYSGLDELNRSLDPSKDIAKGTICEET